MMELKKLARKRLDRKHTLGIIPNSDEQTYNTIDQAVKTIFSKRKTDAQSSSILQQHAISIERKMMHRESFKKLEKRNFYSQILAPPDAAGSSIKNTSVVEKTEEQQAAIKRMYDIDTYMTKSNKKVRAQNKRQLLREQSLMKSNLHKNIHE